MTPGLTQAISRGAGSTRADQDQCTARTVQMIPGELAEIVAERTRSQVVQVIGKKIVLYKEGKDEKEDCFHNIDKIYFS